MTASGVEAAAAVQSGTVNGHSSPSLPTMPLLVHSTRSGKLELGHDRIFRIKMGEFVYAVRPA
jgi:hypothetical protein